MFFVFAYNHVVAKGSAEKHVTCEHCGQAFSYLLTRKAALDTIPLPSLTRQAGEISQQRCADALAKGVEAVSCPSCGWVQAHMVVELRRRVASWLRTLGIYLAVACGGMALFAIALGVFLDEINDFDATGMALASAGACAVSLLTLPIRCLLGRLRYRRDIGFKARKPLGQGRLIPTARPIAA
jgi:hypothetical protein